MKTSFVKKKMDWFKGAPVRSSVNNQPIDNVGQVQIKRSVNSKKISDIVKQQRKNLGETILQLEKQKMILRPQTDIRQINGFLDYRRMNPNQTLSIKEYSKASHERCSADGHSLCQNNIEMAPISSKIVRSRAKDKVPKLNLQKAKFSQIQEKLNKLKTPMNRQTRVLSEDREEDPHQIKMREFLSPINTQRVKTGNLPSISDYSRIPLKSQRPAYKGDTHQYFREFYRNFLNQAISESERLLQKPSTQLTHKLAQDIQKKIMNCPHSKSKGMLS